MHESHKLPVVEMPRLELPASVKGVLKEAESWLESRPGLLRLFRNCYPNTLETTTKLCEDGTSFVITGDIPAMWLRDSVEQVFHYIPLTARDGEMRRIVLGLIRRQAACVLHDPYANAFNEESNGHHWDAGDITDIPVSPLVWERKFELDSLCFFVRLVYAYWRTTRDDGLFDAELVAALRTVSDLFATEQRHEELSSYRFSRSNCPPHDTLHHGGRGTPVGWTGMIWSGFRPSDDACDYHYFIPGNMMAVVALRQLREMAESRGEPADYLKELARLEEEVNEGIVRYGIVRHPEYGEIYAFETDGLGNFRLMDDAGTPSLLSIPYFGYASADDPIYLNTRAFILSSNNPYYYEGSAAKGIGSPHTPPDYIWPMALSMQGLTSRSDEELLEMLSVLEATDAGTGYMHEGFHASDPSRYTRPWFAWSNSLFAQLVLKAAERGLLADTAKGDRTT